MPCLKSDSTKDRPGAGRTGSPSPPRQSAGRRLLRLLTPKRKEQKKSLSPTSIDPRRLSYPEYYGTPYDPRLGRRLSKEEIERLILTQAIAQEKVGFERGAPKFFIEDFDPLLQDPLARKPKPYRKTLTPGEEASLYRTPLAGRLVNGLGGGLVGAGLALIATTPGAPHDLPWVLIILGTLLIVFGP